MRTFLIATTLALVAHSHAVAQDAPSTVGGAIGNVFESLGVRKPPPAAPDFVRDSRPPPEQLDYEPMKPKPASETKKNVESLSASGPELERAAAEARRRASRVKVPN
jgi:hypothetical protein